VRAHNLNSHRTLMLIALVAALASCGGGSDSDTAPLEPISVAVSGGNETIYPGQTSQVIATVSNDTSNRGVTWSVSCSEAPCGSVSPTATASGATATYTAPAGVLPADLTVSIVATSVRDATKNASASVQVSAEMVLTLEPGTDTVVPGGSTMSFTATVFNDAANAGVSWGVSCSTPPCGTLSATSTASGVSTTYTAPPTLIGSDVDVTLTATSVSNGTVTNSDIVIVPGRYVVLVMSPQTLGAGDSTQITGSVNADASNQGVTWTLQCAAADCGTLSASTSPSGTPITYNAPKAPVKADLAVTVTATSVSAPIVQATLAVTIAAITVAVDPTSALLPLNAAQIFTGNMQYSAIDNYLNWTVTQNGIACPTACGTFSPPQTGDTDPVTYTAPATMPAASTITITATSDADPTKSATAMVQLTTGSVKVVPMSLNLALRNGKKCGLAKQTATLTNTGMSALTINSITIGGTNPGAFTQKNTCGAGLDQEASCEITVNPVCSQITGGYATAVLSISDSSTDSPQQLSLTVGTPPEATSAMRSALAAQFAISVPAPSGSSMVGTRLIHLTDPNRADPYVPNATARELMVRFWYPAAPGGRCTKADYTSPQVWSYFATLLDVALPQVSTHSCLDSRIASGVHPVVLVTPGFTGTFTDYTFLAEDLASRGYVVAAVDHTHEATAVEFPDGHVEKSVFGSHLTQYTRSDAEALGQAVAVRLDDLRFVLDQLTTMNRANNEPFAGHFDLTRVALAGHSLGGLTTLQALASERRFKAGIVLDGAVSPQPLQAIQQPVLTVFTGNANADADECRMWNALQGTRVAVSLPGAEHTALSDEVWLAAASVKTGGVSPEGLVSAVRRDVASFLDATFKGFSAGQHSMNLGTSFPRAMLTSGAQLGCTAQ